MRYSTTRIFISIILLEILAFSNGVLGLLTVRVELSPGKYLVGLKEIGYDAFYGIPYALPPLGSLRFRDPQPVPLWTGTHLAMTPRLYCMQFQSQILPFPDGGTEDCLYLDVYRPQRRPANLLNVIVHIHGGGFVGGLSSPLFYGSEYFMETEEVILVNFAYRLNVFGFMCTGDSASPGNYGLKDQEMAIRWVKTNIRAFGGDPEKITILGQSAGSVSVNYHLLNSRSEGLFKNAYMISGTVDAPWAKLMTNPREVLNAHANALGIQNATDWASADLVEYFRSLPAIKLVSTIPKLYEWENLPMAAYRPVIEPPSTPNAFITADPKISIKTGRFLRVPIMSSIVPADGINFVQPIVRLNGEYEDFNTNMYQRMPVVLQMNVSHPNMTAIVDLVRSKYLGSGGNVTPSGFDKIIKLSTDYHFEKPFYDTLRQMANFTDVYVHTFNYKGMSSMAFYFTSSIRDFGIVHTDDILFLFRSPGVFPIQLSIKDKIMQSHYMKHILQFVKDNDPGYNKWNPETEDPVMARFGGSTDNLALVDYVPVNKHEFWDDIYKMYN